MSSKAKTAPTEPIQLTDQDEFAETVRAYDVVLVDFYADWCGPCQMMEPTIESIAADSEAAVLKVDVDRFQALAAQYGVQGIPTLLVFAEGEQAERLVGMKTDEQLTSVIEGYAQ
jgi:thioredoxin 1